MALVPPPEDRSPSDAEPARAGPSPPLGDRSSRRRDVARFSASAGAGYLAARVRALTQGEGAEQLFHADTAAKVVELLGGMKGAAMKIGQIASFVDLDLPPEVQDTYQEALADLRAAAPPVDSDEIARVITEQYGAPPEQVFAHWNPEPLASASIGQVHRARLPDGTEVVTKVQYPGVAEAIEADLANAEALAPLVKMVSPSLRVRPLMEELRVRLSDELDYQREATYQHAFHERYDGHPFIRVPRVHREWCRPRVLVTDYAAGASFEEMMATADRATQQRYGEIIFRFVFGSLHRFRLFNGDPHPGNYLFPADGTVVFLDFGSVKAFSSQARATMVAQLRALQAGDAERLVAVLRDAGFLPGGRVDPQRLYSWFATFNRPVLSDRVFSYTAEFAREVIRTTSDPRGGYLDLIRKLNLPPEYLLLNRIQWGVNSILGRLRATANWYRISREFWEDGPPATDLGALERPFVDASPFRV